MPFPKPVQLPGVALLRSLAGSESLEETQSVLRQIAIAYEILPSDFCLRQGPVFSTFLRQVTRSMGSADGRMYLSVYDPDGKPPEVPEVEDLHGLWLWIVRLCQNLPEDSDYLLHHPTRDYAEGLWEEVCWWHVCLQDPHEAAEWSNSVVDRFPADSVESVIPLLQSMEQFHERYMLSRAAAHRSFRRMLDLVRNTVELSLLRIRLDALVRSARYRHIVELMRAGEINLVAAERLSHQHLLHQAHVSYADTRADLQDSMMDPSAALSDFYFRQASYPVQRSALLRKIKQSPDR